MSLHKLVPMLYTTQLEATVQFYQTVLGFRLDSWDQAAGWASLSRDKVSIMLSLPNIHTPFNAPLFTGSFYFETDAVDQLWEQVGGKANLCYPIEDFEYGMREFAIYDPNGYLLQFGQPLTR